MNRRDLIKLAAAAGMAGAGVVYPGARSFAAIPAYDLNVERTRITIDGRTAPALAIGGSVPGPVLRWKEGEEVVVRVINRTDEPTSIHWHGLLLVGVMDGAPGFNAFVAIQPGETYTYRFQLRQSGTYWYHSHSAGQEQSGMYGAIVIEPARVDAVKADRDYVVLLSDHTAEDPAEILRKLKSNPEAYVTRQRTVGDFFNDVGRDGLGATVSDRLMWGKMRMSPTDLADVTGYQFLMNGMGPRDNWTGIFKGGERVRLRIINGSSMTFFDVRIPGLKMTVVAADGQNVVPVLVNEFRFGVGETYDVIVSPQSDRAYTIMAEPIDRSGFVRGTLAPRAGMEAAIPPQRARALLSMGDMGTMEGMDHGSMAGMDHNSMGGSSGSMAGMDHSKMPGMGGAKPDAMAGMDHSKMPGMGGTKPDAMAGMDHSKMPGMGGTKPDAMAGMDHSSMPGMGSMTSQPGGSAAAPVGWSQTGTLPGEKALAYEDLKSLVPRADDRPPVQEVVVNLNGVMNRYNWTLNGKRFDQATPIRVAQGDRVRIRYVNDNMMAHPMHLHGMFVELENGQTTRRPLKHVTIVKPGAELSVILTASEVGEWPFHCHLLYHMNAGMMTRFVVEPRRLAAAQ
jgi:CopA family copper-resistance protein